MARCEDFPCCGHEAGCCPRYDASGRQLDMVCTCGARLPVTSRSSICRACLMAGDPEDGDYDDHDHDQYERDYEGDDYEGDYEGDDEPEGDFYSDRYGDW